jgi:hypothetical protein
VVGVNPVMELVNKPVPVPSLVQVPPAVKTGFADVSQQTPLESTDAPPSELMFPPLAASVVVIPETAAVLRIGGVTGTVEKKSKTPF